MTKIIYKICDQADWRSAEAAGFYAGAPVDLKDGFTRFFRKQNKYPHFRSRDDFKQSVRYQDTELLGTWIKIPKCGWIRLKYTRELKQPKMITISQEGNYWFASFNYDTLELEPVVTANQIIGIELGLKDFAITTNEL